MKAKGFCEFVVFIVGLALGAGLLPAEPVHLGFTYQGILEDAGLPADGPYDLAFTVYDDPFVGDPLDGTLVLDNVQVEGGVFSVELTFSPSIFDGSQTWLEIEVRSGESIDPEAFVILGPRQKINPVPYALYSLSAGTVRHGTGELTVSGLNPQQSTNLGRVNFNYSFASPPVVIVTGLYDQLAPRPYIPHVGAIDNDGFDLHLMNPTSSVQSSRTYGFNWIASGNGSLLQTWYRDLDLDDYSDGVRIDSYEQPSGYRSGSFLAGTSGDCDDTNPAINPGAPEIWYDGVDQNCDGLSDYDQDMDGFDAVAFGGTDCDDLDRWVHPGAMELCNGQDDDCDGFVDNDCIDRDCSDEMTDLFLAAYEACLNEGGSPQNCFIETISVVGYVPCEDTLLNLPFCSPNISLCFLFDPAQLDACLYANCPVDYERIFGVPEDADEDGYNVFVDCDDSDPLINPSATEVWYDGVDQDCDGLSDYDQDKDGFDSDAYGGDDCDDTDASINPGAFDICGDGIDQDCDGSDRACEDRDGDGFTEDVDCDDDDPSVYPGAPEIPYDDIDQDCDGSDLWDADGDGYDADFMGGGDCDDGDPTINPGAAEICDWKDNDCDGETDEECIGGDLDGDSFTSWEYGGEDCDDSDVNVYPGAPEVPYDGVDQDCDGFDLRDVDDDGYEAEAVGGSDCDDNDPDVHPGAVDIWYDGIDQNCDGHSDYDQDYDGFDADSYGGDDCDDTDPNIYPGAIDNWYDGIDQNCDGLSDYDRDMDGYDADGYGGDDCNDFDPDIHPGAVEIWYDGIDQDCDGHSDYDQDFDGYNADGYGGDDCDDTNPDIFPGAVEMPYDGVDQDCDGFDLRDVDDDGYESEIVGGTDCDDHDPNIHPGAVEIWYDGVDQDCDGHSDYDQDFDGYTADSYGGDDCDDTNPSIFPGAVEIPYDGVDQDCDGFDLRDVDDDGFESEIIGGTDCDDDDPDIHPGAVEIWYDGWDQDCDGHSDYDQDFDGYNADGYGGDDCDDTNPNIYPGAPEIPDNFIDENCDGYDYTILTLSTFPVGGLVITEIMYDPTVVVDPAGEWFEVVNVTGDGVDLNGLEISDQSNTHVVSGVLMLPPNGIIVFGFATSATNGGAPVDYVYGNSIQLSNSADSITLSYDGRTFDSVYYNESGSWPTATGASISLDPAYTDASLNNVGANWCLGSNPYGLGDFGSPGSTNPSCP